MKIDSNLSSLHSEREGEAPQALLGEGATPLRGQAQAPVIERGGKYA